MAKHWIIDKHNPHLISSTKLTDFTQPEKSIFCRLYNLRKNVSEGMKKTGEIVKEREAAENMTTIYWKCAKTIVMATETMATWLTMSSKASFRAVINSTATSGITVVTQVREEIIGMSWKNKGQRWIGMICHSTRSWPAQWISSRQHWSQKRSWGNLYATVVPVLCDHPFCQANMVT